jgi:hypothetical protein
VLDATPGDHLTYLVSAYGRSFTAASFGNWFRDACDAAGLKTLTEVERYTAAADQERMARDAMLSS